MTTKTNPVSPLSSEAERLKALLLAAEDAQELKARETEELLSSLPGELLAAEEAEEQASTNLRVIEHGFAQGDSSVSDEDYASALAAVKRAGLITQGLRNRLKTLSPTNTSTDVAQAVASVVPHVLGPAVPVVVTHLRENEARAILRAETGVEPTCVLLSQTTPTKHAGWGHSDAGGVIAGTVDLRYLGRQQHMSSLRHMDLKRQASAVGMDFGGPGAGYDATNSFRVDVRAGHVGLPRLAEAPMHDQNRLTNLSRRVASAVAHGERLRSGAIANNDGDGTYRSLVARTRADGAEVVSVETVDGVRRCVVDVRVAVKLTAERDLPVSARAMQAGYDATPVRRAGSYVEQSLGNVSGAMLAFFGVVESGEVLADGYHAEPIEMGHIDAHQSPVAQGIKVRLTFVSAPR